MKKLHAHQTGYTLIELLLYAVIVSSLLLGVTSFFLLTSSSRIKSQTIAEVDQQGVFVMDTITATIRNATSVSAPTAGATGATLNLVVPTVSLSPTVFALNGTTLQITEGAGSPVALTSNQLTVTNLTFTNLTRSGTNGVVRVSFTLNRVNPLNRNEYDYQKTFTGSAAVRW